MQQTLSPRNSSPWLTAPARLLMVSLAMLTGTAACCHAQAGRPAVARGARPATRPAAATATAPAAGSPAVLRSTSLKPKYDFFDPEYLSIPANFPQPKSFIIKRAKGAVAIDGNMNEPAWNNAPLIDEFYEMNLPKLAPPGHTKARMLWDDKYLYFGFICEDSNIDAPKLPRDGEIYFHDCVEVFLMPLFERHLYWEVNVSPSGSLLDCFASKYYSAFTSYMFYDETVEGLLFATTLTGPAGKPTGYVTEIAFPIDQLPGWGEPKAGKTMRLLLSRIDADGTQKYKGYAVTPITRWFHNVWCWATATLED